MEDIIQVKDQFYVRATSSLADQRTRSLKDGDTFAVFDVFGDIQPMFGQGSQGVYDGATRFLSHFELRIGDDHPLLLSSTVQDNNMLMTVDLMNPDLKNIDGTLLPRGAVHVFRSKFLHGKTCYERLCLTNFSLSRAEFSVGFKFNADFVDLFEVRGVKREKRGQLQPAQVGPDFTKLSYLGLDKVARGTKIAFCPAPASMGANHASYSLSLAPQEQFIISVAIACQPDERIEFPREPSASPEIFAAALKEATSVLNNACRTDCHVASLNPQVNELLNRSKSDLHMMITDTAKGPYPYAGLPWYSTVFGRDGIITALQSLWLSPDIARGVLAYLASTQATEIIAKQDAEPGKILHERRDGEMVALGEVPFEKYYGSIDATPLFVVLAGSYYKRTGDLEFIKGIWGNIERALNWIARYGDADGDGFVEYQRKTPDGLSNQGWKDSEDSVSHADGTLAKGPVALCEVQGYVYRAKKSAANLAKELGYHDIHDQLEAEAEALKRKFNELFWCDEIDTFAIALDGDKRLCKIRSSNPGHCLFSLIVDDKYAARVCHSLMTPDMFTGWGIRTLSGDAKRYNPMSYHNGSIWPHDNALIAAGLSNYGFKEEVIKIMKSQVDASLFMDLHRLPELYCGFDRRRGEGPTLYPVACSPQSWASGSIFMLLKAALGMTVNARRERINFHFPVLPEFVPELSIKNLRVGEVVVDLLLRRSHQDVSINILNKSGPVEIVVYH